jgi:hypothetical protein
MAKNASAAARSRRAPPSCFETVSFGGSSMKHPIFAVATTATFVAGVIVGHYAVPRSVKLSAPALSAANEISTRSSERTSPTLSISAPNQFDPAALPSGREYLEKARDHMHRRLSPRFARQSENYFRQD